VAGEHLLGSAPLSVLFLVLLHVEFPLDQTPITRTREKEFNFLFTDLLLANCKSCDPAAVAFEETLVLESML